MRYVKSKFQALGLTVSFCLVLVCCTVLIIPDIHLKPSAEAVYRTPNIAALEQRRLQSHDYIEDNSSDPGLTKMFPNTNGYTNDRSLAHGHNVDFVGNKSSSIASGGPSTGHTPHEAESPSNMKTAGNITSKTAVVTHVVFLKVHKAASTTLQTMFFRFGYQRHLSFVLPVEGNYFSKSTKNHKELIKPRKGMHYDILCNHGYFNYSIFSPLMPRDTVYLAIVRDPLQQFISSYNYYTSVYKFSYLSKIKGNAIEKLITSPKTHEKNYPLSYTMNSMAKDFGFTKQHFYGYTPGDDNSSAHAYLETLGGIFDLVLVKEYLDESIIFMKRRLNWSLRDILYIPKNVNGPETTVLQEKHMTMFRKRNKLDYLLYEFFLQRFKLKLDQEGDSIYAEVRNFKRVLFKVQRWCNDQYFGSFKIESSTWNEGFSIDTEECALLAKNEWTFINILKETMEHSVPLNR